jgi:hypothetical protein
VLAKASSNLTSGQDNIVTCLPKAGTAEIRRPLLGIGFVNTIPLQLKLHD